MDAKPLRAHHQFGPNADKYNTICSVHFPFWGVDRHEPLFDIQFDVIEGDLPFLVGIPSLAAMRANLNFSYKWLGVLAGEEYLKLALQYIESHVILPFRAVLKKDDRRRSSPPCKSSYYMPTRRQYSEDESSVTKDLRPTTPRSLQRSQERAQHRVMINLNQPYMRMPMPHRSASYTRCTILPRATRATKPVTYQNMTTSLATTRKVITFIFPGHQPRRGASHSPNCVISPSS